MRHVLLGVGVGAALTLAVLAAAVSGGWLPLGPADAPPAAATRPQPTGADAGQHAEHDMGAMAMPGMEMDAEPGSAGDAITISVERQQLIGVRTTTVERRRLRKTIRTVGRVEYDERRVAHIHTKVSGWIERLYVDFTGKLVEKGQALLEIYSPELVSTQEEYLLAVRATESLGASAFPEVARGASGLLEATRRRLLLWDVTEEQITALEKRDAPERTMTVYSPIRGFVIHKGAYEGKYVGPRDELYTIADLAEVWVLADIYEYELPFVSVGQRAAVTLPYFPGETFEGRVDYIYPYMEPETRTAKVRLVFPNPEGKLKPDMYANVELAVELGEGLVIPEDAVIDTGTRQVAFLVLPGGRFLPREIKVGRGLDGQLEVLDGLQEGDEIVAGATFLVDSETKLRSALRAMAGHQH